MANKLDNHMIIRIVLIVLAAVILFALIIYYNSKQTSAAKTQEKFNQDALVRKYMPKEKSIMHVYACIIGRNLSFELK